MSFDEFQGKKINFQADFKYCGFEQVPWHHKYDLQIDRKVAFPQAFAIKVPRRGDLAEGKEEKYGKRVDWGE